MKQYLIICEENVLPQLRALFSPSIQFLEVQGMPMQGSTGHILITPPQLPLTSPEPQAEEPKVE